jgi:hypothetical protein
MTPKQRFLFSTVASFLLLLSASACETPQPGAKPLFADLFGPQPPPAKPSRGSASSTKAAPDVDVTLVPTRDDITAVYQFFAQDPWLRNTEGRVIGITSSVYFHSGATEKGAFVPGTVLCWVYEFDRRPDGTLERKLVNVWELSEQEAMGYRVRRQSQMGYAYGFFFTWPPGVDVSGKTIEIMFGYERLDGKMITGAARRFKVPMSRYATSPPGPTELPRRTPQSPEPRPETQPPAPSEAKPDPEPSL